MGRKKSDHWIGRWLRDNGLVITLFLLLAAAAVYGIRSASTASYEEERRIAEQSVRRAAVSCYAMEGFYPDSFDYLRNHYGVRIDEQKFFVQYEVFGSNLMPEITILEVSR